MLELGKVLPPLALVPGLCGYCLNASSFFSVSSPHTPLLGLLLVLQMG